MGLKLGPVVAVLIGGRSCGSDGCGRATMVRGGIGPKGEPVIIADRNEAAEAEPFAVRTTLAQPARARRDAGGARAHPGAGLRARARADERARSRSAWSPRAQRVTPGTEVCRLDRGTRESVLDAGPRPRWHRPQAALVQAEFDLQSNTELAEKRLRRRVAPQRACAPPPTPRGAQVAQARVADRPGRGGAVAQPSVVARASGIVQDPVAEVGDVLQPGDVCVTLVDTDPLLVTGQVPETEVGALDVGMDAGVRLVTGEEVAGEVTFIAAAADPGDAHLRHRDRGAQRG